MKRDGTWLPGAQLDVRIYMRRKICYLRWKVQNNLFYTSRKVVGVRGEIAVEWSVRCNLEARVQNGGVQNVRFFSAKVNLGVSWESMLTSRERSPA
jgi:hypothetical protein